MTQEASESLLPDNPRKAPLGFNSDAVVAAIECLWRQKITLLISAVVTAILCVLLVFFVAHPRYRAEVLVLPPNSTASTGLPVLSGLAAVSSQGAGGLMSSLLGGPMSSDLLSDALTSNYLEDRIIDRFNLLSVYDKKTHQAARKKLEHKSSITVNAKSGVVTVDVIDPEPTRAAAMANAYAEELDHVLVRMNTEAAASQRLFYEQRLAQAKQDLLNASNEFSKFTSTNRTLNIDEQTKATVESAAALEGQIIAAQADLKAMEQLYTGQNPQVIQARARVAALQAELSKISVGLPGEKQTAGNQGTGSASGPLKEQLFPSITQLPGIGVKYLDLYREVKVREAVYELVIQQYYVARLQETQAAAGVQVLSPATVPESELLFRYILGAVLWLLLNLGVAAWLLLREVWRNMNVEDPRKRFITQVTQVLSGR